MTSLVIEGTFNSDTLSQVMQEKFRPNYLLLNFKRSKESGILGASSLLVLKILKMNSYPNYAFLKFRKEGILHRVWMSEDFFNCVMLAVEKKFAKNLSKRAPHLKKQNSHSKLEIERALHFSCKTVRRALPQGPQAIFPLLELFGEMPSRPLGGPFLSNSTTCRLVFSGPRFRSLNAPWGGLHFRWVPVRPKWTKTPFPPLLGHFGRILGSIVKWWPFSERKLRTEKVSNDHSSSAVWCMVVSHWTKNCSQQFFIFDCCSSAVAVHLILFISCCWCCCPSHLVLLFTWSMHGKRG